MGRGDFERKGYRCSVLLWSCLFLGVVLCACSTDTGGNGGGDGSVTGTLGSVAGAEECCGKVGGTTLGDISWYAGNASGILSILFSCVARVTRVLRIGSPSCKLGVEVEGGSVRMEIMLIATRRKKSWSLISGKGMVVGKMSPCHSLV